MRRAPLALCAWPLLFCACVSAPREAVLRAQDLRAASSRELRRAARSPLASRRREALLAMARIQSPAYVEDEAARLADRSESVRLAAAFALGQLGLAEPPPWAEARQALADAKSRAASRLRALLNASSYRLRAAGYEGVGKTGAASDEQPLAAGLRDRDPAAREQAALALFRLRMSGALPAFSTATARALRVAFSDPAPEVRRAAVYPFSRYAEPRNAQALASACGPDESDRWTRLYACRALGLIGAEAPWEELARTQADGDPLLRYEAVRSLGLQKRGAYLIDGVYADPSAYVRAAVAEALAATGDKKSAYKLDAVEEDGSVLVRAAVTSAYAKLKPRDQTLRRLEQDARDQRWWVRSKAYEAYAEAGAGAALWAKGAALDADPRVAAAQLEALVDTEASRSTEAAAGMLAQVLADTSAPVEVVGTAVELALKHPSGALLPGLKGVRESALGKRYPEVGGDAAEAFNAVASTLSLPAPPLAPVPAQPAEPSPWLNAQPPPTSVVLVTARGEVELSLAVREAPIHAAAFIDSVRRGVYDGLTWHRVVPGFVAQGGDPRGSGWGDCGFSLRDEINALPFDRGVLGMPKAGKDTGGCQLFVTLVPTPHLDGRYTVFGRVTRGMDVIDALEPGDLIRKAYVVGDRRELSRHTP